MNKWKLLVASCLSVFFSAAPAMADTYPTGPVTFGGSSEASLQDVLDGITVAPTAGDSSVDVTTDALLDEWDSYWNIPESGHLDFTLIIELSGWSGTTSFGVFDIADS